MPELPVMANYINAATSVYSPNTVHVKNTALSAFFRRYLMQKAMSVFKWDMPKGWAENYFLYCLYCYGFVAVVRTDKYGVIPQAGTLSGYDVFYQPTNVQITNPLIQGQLMPRIGKQCSVVRLQPDYGGIGDLIGYYADMMALCAEAAGVNLFNSKLAWVFLSANKNAAESFKKMFDQISSGNPAAFIDKDLANIDGNQSWQMFAQNLKNNYIVPENLADMRKIEAMFDTDVGIPNANTDKRERLVRDEVNANNTETTCKAALWLEQLQKDCKAVNAMFGAYMERPLSVKWRFNPNGGELIVPDTVRTGAV